MSNDDGGYALAQRALSEAREASSEASAARQEAEAALRAAHDAMRVAERADDKADRALAEIRELRQRVSNLEDAVEHLINMLQSEIRTLIEHTQQVERAVEAQGEAISSTVRENTEAVESGFTAMGRQEAENRLLDSRTALAGLSVRLEEARMALEAEYEQADRRRWSQKDRYTKLAAETKRSLDNDIARLGAAILTIQARDFAPLVRRTEHLDDGAPQAFDVARQVGEVSLEQRAAAIERHIKKLDVDLERFSADRRGLITAVERFRHPNLHLPEGTYALRVYQAESGSGPELLIGATVDTGGAQVTFTPITNGLGTFGPPVEAAWDRGRQQARPLSADEQIRVSAYLDRFREAGLLTSQELGLLKHHVDRGGIEIQTVSVE